MKREILAILSSLLLLALLLLLLGELLISDKLILSTDWRAYRAERENSTDVFFVGSSLVFCDVIPAEIYQKTGITSYNICGGEQTIPISYYYIREACKTQKPKMIFLELGGMFFSQYEEFSKANIVIMPKGRNRLEAVFNAALRSDRSWLLLPILKYHSNYKSLNAETFKKLLRPAEPDVTAGYNLRENVNENGSPTETSFDTSYYDYSLSYVGKIAEYCEKNGIELCFFLSPRLKLADRAQREKLKNDIDVFPHLCFFDFCSEESVANVGLDYASDWSDDVHLNLPGAVKFSDYLAELLTGLGCEPSENADAELWSRRMDYIAQALDSLTKLSDNPA